MSKEKTNETKKIDAKKTLHISENIDNCEPMEKDIIDGVIENLDYLQVNELDEVIKKANKCISVIKEQKREAVKDKIREMANEKNLLKKRIYSNRDIAEYLKITNKLVGEVVKNMEDDSTSTSKETEK